MKSRISYFNPTIFKKNITRFAPVWGLYTVCLLMGLVLMADTNLDYWFISNLAQCITVMPAINLCYALVCSIVLFGDLYNSRMCNALHALPLRREGWFLTNVLSGLCFSLVPSLVMTLIAIPLACVSVVSGDWQMPLVWLLGNNLQFIAFFGIAVFSALCVGSRFAQAVVYGILNFGSLLALWLVDQLYTPMLYGVETREDGFLKLCPVVRMCSESYVELEWEVIDTYDRYEIISGSFQLNENWSILALWAGVGLVLMALALMLYRKRALETAGDFIAVKPFQPVFHIIYTLVVGVGFQFFAYLFLGSSMSLVWLFVGLPVGYFTGLMLLERSAKVFRKRAFLGFAAVAAVMVLSLVATAMDVFGIESRIPEADQVKKATIYNHHVYYGNDGNCVTFTEEEDIEEIIRLHELALEYYDGQGEFRDDTFYFTLEYELADGTTMTRYYYGGVNGEMGQIVEPKFSNTEMVLGVSEEELPAFAEEISYLYINGVDMMDNLTEEQIEQLLQAIAADCREGNMAQISQFHPELAYDEDYYHIEFEFHTEKGYTTWRTVTVFPDSSHTLEWLAENFDGKYDDMKW